MGKASAVQRIRECKIDENMRTDEISTETRQNSGMQRLVPILADQKSRRVVGHLEPSA
jgi:hypothetical protein